MKCQLIIIFGCVAILPKIVYNAKTRERLRRDLISFSSSGAAIDNVLKPINADEGYVSYDGGSTETKVILQLFTKDEVDRYERAINNMRSLNAIKNPDVEKYGIQNIYYHGPWQDGKIIATSFCNETVHRFNLMDIGLTMKYHVRALKYIHSHGLRITPHRMISQTFDGIKFYLMGVSYATNTMNEVSSVLSFRDDWRIFVYSIPTYKCSLMSNSGWMQILANISNFDIDRYLTLSTHNEITFDLLKEFRLGVRKLIQKLKSKKNKQYEKLLRIFIDESVLIHFKNYLMIVDDYPDYDYADDVINKTLLALDEPLIFTWATDTEKEYAKDKWLRFKNNQTDEFPLDGVDIKSIKIDKQRLDSNEPMSLKERKRSEESDAHKIYTLDDSTDEIFDQQNDNRNLIDPMIWFNDEHPNFEP